MPYIHDEYERVSVILAISMRLSTNPVLTEPIVKLDWAGRGFSLKIRGDASKTQRHSRRC